METGAVVQSRGEQTKGFSVTSSFLKCESQGHHPAHPGVNEAEGTHTDAPERTNAGCTFHVTHLAASSERLFDTPSAHQLSTPNPQPTFRATSTLLPLTRHGKGRVGSRGTVYSRQKPQAPANRFALP